jgi:hypothetical protein
MTKIALDIDDKVLALVQQYAAEIGTTIEAIVVEHLRGIAWENSPEREELAARARKELVRMSEESPERLGPDWKWNRADAYEGRLPASAFEPYDEDRN